MRRMSCQRNKLILTTLLITTACSRPMNIIPRTVGRVGPERALPLSISNPELRSCKYPEGTRIAHFPMFHYPPTGFNGNREMFERVSASQFQLLHTILSYKPQVAVFSESVFLNHYNTRTFSYLKQGLDRTTFSLFDGTRFELPERYRTAGGLFPANRGVPQFYEHLTQSQKEFLSFTGGARTAWLLGQIPHIYKSATEQDRAAVRSNLNRISNTKYNGSLQQLLDTPEGTDQERDYWLLHYRESRLMEEVNQFFRQNPSFRGLVLIAYGAFHNLNNEFPTSFSDGSFCLSWDRAGTTLRP